MQGLEACVLFNFPYIQREVKTRTPSDTEGVRHPKIPCVPSVDVRCAVEGPLPAGKRQNPNPSHTEGFATPRVQLCLSEVRWRGRFGHPPQASTKSTCLYLNSAITPVLQAGEQNTTLCVRMMPTTGDWRRKTQSESQRLAVEAEGA
jgi:hypothetical protein